jgi:YesN/AraC family two-component response regulator
LKEIKEYIESHFSEKITLDNLAAQFYINKFYLSRLFKEQFGISVNNYLLQLRTTRAKQLLRFSDLSIEQIGQRCGMDDANYFSRMFKKIEGSTPGEYRRRW